MDRNGQIVRNIQHSKTVPEIKNMRLIRSTEIETVIKRKKKKKKNLNKRKSKARGLHG